MSLGESVLLLLRSCSGFCLGCILGVHLGCFVLFRRVPSKIVSLRKQALNAPVEEASPSLHRHGYRFASLRDNHTLRSALVNRGTTELQASRIGGRSLILAAKARCLLLVAVGVVAHVHSRVNVRWRVKVRVHLVKAQITIVQADLQRNRLAT